MRLAEMSQMSTADLIRRLVNNISGLVDREVALAKEEIREDVKDSLASAVLMISAAVLLLIGVTCLVVAAIFALALVMPGWLASIIVAAFFIIVGAIVGLIGKSKLTTHPLKKTRESLSEDILWAQGRLKR
ncbi:MAG: phage holin family protein [Chloroflexi bacterium]|nr:phage holin family protein [Chloroflexota bacterium]